MTGQNVHRRAARMLAVLCLLSALAGARAYAGFDEGMAAYEKGEYQAAFAQWLPLADKGDAAAEYALAKMYQHGLGAPRNYALAASWYKKAADAGYAYAMYGLGFLNEFGQGGPVDRKKAIKYYEQAAQRQVPEAQIRLGYVLSGKREGIRDIKRAYFWSSIAAANPYAPAALQKEAVDLRNTIESKMTRGQIGAAQELTATWKPMEYKISP